MATSRAAIRFDKVFDDDGKALIADIIDRPALFIALANSRQYGNGAQIAPRALLDDGMIEIVVVEPQSGLSITAAGAGVFPRHTARRPGTADAIARRRWRSRARHPIRFHVDGEPRKGPNRIALHTRRGVLSVKVNR